MTRFQSGDTAYTHGGEPVKIIERRLTGACAAIGWLVLSLWDGKRYTVDDIELRDPEADNG